MEKRKKKKEEKELLSLPNSLNIICNYFDNEKDKSMEVILSRKQKFSPVRQCARGLFLRKIDISLVDFRGRGDVDTNDCLGEARKV